MRTNISISDRWAINWLANNKTITDCPADKNLGSAILSRELYDMHMFGALHESFEIISEVEANGIVRCAQDRIKYAVAEAVYTNMSEVYMIPHY